MVIHPSNAEGLYMLGICPMSWELTSKEKRPLHSRLCL